MNMQNDMEIMQDCIEKLTKESVVWIKNFRDENIKLGNAELTPQSKTYEFDRDHTLDDTFTVSTKLVTLNDNGFKNSERWVATFSITDDHRGWNKKPMFTVSCLRDLTDVEITFTQLFFSSVPGDLFDLIEQGAEKPEEIIWGDSETKKIKSLSFYL